MLENISPSVYLYFEIRFYNNDKMKVQIQMNISKHTLYFNVILIILIPYQLVLLLQLQLQLIVVKSILPLHHQLY